MTGDNVIDENSNKFTLKNVSALVLPQAYTHTSHLCH